MYPGADSPSPAEKQGRQVASRIVLSDPFADLKKIGLCLVGEESFIEPRLCAFC